MHQRPQTCEAQMILKLKPQTFSSYVMYISVIFTAVLYLWADGLVLEWSATELWSLFWDLVSGVESGSLFSSALVFSMRLS